MSARYESSLYISFNRFLSALYSSIMSMNRLCLISNCWCFIKLFEISVICLKEITFFVIFIGAFGFSFTCAIARVWSINLTLFFNDLIFVTWGGNMSGSYTTDFFITQNVYNKMFRNAQLCMVCWKTHIYLDILLIFYKIFFLKAFQVYIGKFRSYQFKAVFSCPTI